MRLLLQRVRRASVTVAGEGVSAIGPGILALVGFGKADGSDFADGPVCRMMLEKVCDLRIFPDAAGKFDVSLRETGGELLLVSQFTLYAACRKGRRPSFSDAAPPEVARQLYDRLLVLAGEVLPGRVASGVFGADMDVSLVNWGPVTIPLDSATFGASRPLDGA
ncbi:D-tyrosyl-tRNA(Tyr) deacylase [Desulfovibrio sp. JY]|nr:D-tyrosyl-tRNA(Tyr) deacylase [Desulfovibrio sp. JY]